ncbi:hypothetical protein GQ54DRAFT_172671 [Martensiomyces pterosporus]|nr:hypothetical protein GQ54DRAFT_172671 [Martensiomyces pterosporus]
MLPYPHSAASALRRICGPASLGRGNQPATIRLRAGKPPLAIPRLLLMAFVPSALISSRLHKAKLNGVPVALTILGATAMWRANIRHAQSALLTLNASLPSHTTTTTNISVH